jgi:hypothetical protein
MHIRENSYSHDRMLRARAGLTPGPTRASPIDLYNDFSLLADRRAPARVKRPRCNGPFRRHTIGRTRRARERPPGRGPESN